MGYAYPEQQARDTWAGVLLRARTELPETTIVMWFADVRAMALESDILTLAVPSTLVKERLQHNHLSLIEEAAAETCARPVKIEFRVDEGLRHPLEDGPVVPADPPPPAS